MQMELLASNSAPEIVGVDELPGKVNYFIGNDPRKWRTDVPTYAKVKYREVYPGVDLVYYGNQQHLEYDFVLAPGGDPQVIALNFSGPDRLEIDAQGDLLLYAAGAAVRQHKPVVYQEAGGIRQEIAGEYVRQGAHQIGFRIGDYDHGKALVIDPALSYSTLLGGSLTDQGYDIAVDQSGNAYVAGTTNSTNFPATAGSFQPTYNPSGDAFIAKLNDTGTALVYATYLGGRSGLADLVFGIAVDSSGNAYVAGGTGSPDFPTTPGAFQTVFSSNPTTFITKLNPTGSGLIYSTFLGRSNQAADIVVDAAGNAYIGGTVYANTLPTTPGAYQAAFGGGFNNAFVTQLNAAGSALVFSTYLGGSNNSCLGQGIAVDSSGNIYVTGFTNSTNFPTTAGAIQANPQGGFDAFLSELNSTGTALSYSTYLGGSANDTGDSVAVDAAGAVYVAGGTGSPNFPTTPGAYQTNFSGSGDAFVTKINTTGASSAHSTKTSASAILVYSTYLGGPGSNGAEGIVVDSAGNAYVVGTTGSLDFPVTDDAFEFRHYSSDIDAFVAQLNAAGTALIYSTYLGGSSTDVARKIAIDAAGNAYVTGYTDSLDFPTTTAAFQLSAGSTNGFVSKIIPARLASDCLITISPSAITVPGAGGTGTVNVFTEADRCAWRSFNGEQDWVTITSSCCGTGNGTVSFQVAKNFSVKSRAATMIIAGQPFQVKQRAR